MHTVGAVLDGGMLHPGRSGRNHLRALAQAAGIGDARVDELLELVALTDAANRRAGGYSLGMRQRLGLAAALLGDPKVLVLDEPANGLDPQGIRWLRDFLRRLAGEGRAILVSSHVLAEVAQTADDVVVIAKGRSVAQAPLQELMAARSGGGMRVAGPDVRRLGDILYAQGARVSGDGDADHGADRTGEQIGRLIAEHQLVISELTSVGAIARGRLLRAHRRPSAEARHDPPDRRRVPQAPHDADVLRPHRLCARASCCCRRSRSRVRELRSEDLRTRSCCSSSARSCSAFALVIGILAVTNEFRHGTITPTLLVMPDRTQLMLAKLVAVLAAWRSARLRRRPDHRRLSRRSSAPLRDFETGGTVLGWSSAGRVATALYAALGLGLGALVRNQVGAIVGVARLHASCSSR